jgi:hypothetical protein
VAKKERPQRNSQNKQYDPTLNPAGGSSVYLYIFRSWSSRLIGRCEVALVESAYLVRGKSANNSVKETPVVEQDKVILAPK